MKNIAQTEIDYPFGNAKSQSLDDTESYHSVPNDDRKQRYFYEQSEKQRNRQNKKTQLPPAYPYEQMKRLKESMKMLKKSSNQIGDNLSARSVESFHTVGQFQSICYQEGDYEKMCIEGEQIGQQGQYPKGQEALNGNNNNYSITSFQSIKYRNETNNEPQQKTKSYSPNRIESKVPIKKLNIQQSNALQIQDLENSSGSDDKYQRFDSDNFLQQKQRILHQQKGYQEYRPKSDDSPNSEIQQRSKYQQKQEEQRSIQISQIQQILNQSQQIDNQILQLTKELQKVQSTQENLAIQNKPNKQSLQKQEELSKRYNLILERLSQLQQIQRNFGSQVNYMNEVMRKTKQNNLYLQKQLEFFKLKTKQIQDKQRVLTQKQKNLNENLHDDSHNNSRSLQEKKRKPKTYNIRPKAPHSLSSQSRKYKQLTFQYAQIQVSKSEEHAWHQLELDSQNSPSEYKIIYSFQQQNTVLVIRLIDLLVNDTSRVSISKKSNSQQPSIKKNYQYMMDFAHKNYKNSQQKLQSLSKELVVDLQQDRYTLKQFTKKIEIFLIITEDDTFVDLIKVVPLPNPLVFYMQKRFQNIREPRVSSLEQKEAKNSANQNQVLNSQEKATNTIQRRLFNLCRFMKTYVIKIQHMVDVQTITKLMGLWWINSSSSNEARYFNIKSQNQLFSNQLFFVKIEECVLESSQGYQKLDLNHRYSLTFRVSSTLDNELLIDVIEFLTFLAVL